MVEDAAGNEFARGEDDYWHITKRKKKGHPFEFVEVGER